MPAPEPEPVPASGAEELCAAAEEGAVPPSIVDLCMRQHGH
ncbi:hypothetical protein ACFV7Q_02760 [Streptomyces sp. NPDC059851]